MSSLALPLDHQWANTIDGGAEEHDVRFPPSDKSFLLLFYCTEEASGLYCTIGRYSGFVT